MPQRIKSDMGATKRGHVLSHPYTWWPKKPKPAETVSHEQSKKTKKFNFKSGGHEIKPFVRTPTVWPSQNTALVSACDLDQFPGPSPPSIGPMEFCGINGCPWIPKISMYFRPNQLWKLKIPSYSVPLRVNLRNSMKINILRTGQL